MLNGDNNCHANFIVNAPMGDTDMGGDDNPDCMPLYESYNLPDLAENLVAGDYEGIMSVTIISSGDVVDVEVSYHITTDGLIDVEKL